MKKKSPENGKQHKCQKHELVSSLEDERDLTVAPTLILRDVSAVAETQFMENYVCELLCRQRGAPSGTLPQPFPTFTEIRVLRIPLPSRGGGSPPMAPPRAGAHRLTLEFMRSQPAGPCPASLQPRPHDG